MDIPFFFPVWIRFPFNRIHFLFEQKKIIDVEKSVFPKSNFEWLFIYLKNY